LAKNWEAEMKVFENLCQLYDRSSMVGPSSLNPFFWPGT
jgi:hypothetical protein